jgi:hypothetical protein
VATLDGSTQFLIGRGPRRTRRQHGETGMSRGGPIRGSFACSKRFCC